ncbi:hypothetical protein GCM10027029_18610 [Conyzicola lurida]
MTARRDDTTAGPVRIPVSDLDRMSGRERLVFVAGPMSVPPRQQLVDNLLAAAELGPQSRVGLQLNEAGDTWTYDRAGLREWCEGLVVEIPPITEDQVVDVLRDRIRDDATPPPFQLTIAGDFIVLRMTHLLGDINILFALFDIAIAAPGREFPSWLLKPEATAPLSLAVRETFGKNPLRVAKVLQSQRSRLGATSFGTTRRGATPLGAVPLGTARFDTTRFDTTPEARTQSSAVVPWQRHADLAYSRGTIQAARDLKSWVRTTPGSVTLATALLVAVRRALVAEGIPVRGESSLIYDSRRYLPDGVVTNGNFIAGLPVPAGLSDDPRQIAQIVKDNVDAASPLAAMLVGALRSRLTGRRFAKPPTTVAAAPAAHVVLTNLGVRRELDTAPWLVGKGEEQFAHWAEPSAPDDLVIGVLQLRGALQVTAFFHGNVFDAERVQAALDRAIGDPVSLLEQH